MSPTHPAPHKLGHPGPITSVLSPNTSSGAEIASVAFQGMVKLDHTNSNTHSKCLAQSQLHESLQLLSLLWPLSPRGRHCHRSWPGRTVQTLVCVQSFQPEASYVVKTSLDFQWHVLLTKCFLCSSTVRGLENKHLKHLFLFFKKSPLEKLGNNGWTLYLIWRPPPFFFLVCQISFLLWF